MRLESLKKIKTKLLYILITDVSIFKPIPSFLINLFLCSMFIHVHVVCWFIYFYTKKILQLIPSRYNTDDCNILYFSAHNALHKSSLGL